MNPLPDRTIGISPLARNVAIAACLFSIAGTHAHADATTAPEGSVNVTLQQGTTTALGLPLLDSAAFRGAAATLTANTIFTAGVTWTNNQFAQAGSPYFVMLLSGAQVGRTLLIAANTANNLTLSVDDTNLNVAGFAVLPGDKFEIFRGDTLASLFGDSAANLTLQAGTSPFTADTVQIHNGIRYLAYYFDTTKGFWLKVNGDGTRQNELVLYPDRGLLVARRGPTTSLAITGRVPTTAPLTRLPGGTTNAVATRFPVDTTLSKWVYAGPGTWIANDSAFVADTINLFNGIRWIAYWKRATDGQWRQLNGDASDQGGVVITAGSSVLIQKRGTGTGSAGFFSQALPYVVDP